MRRVFVVLAATVGLFSGMDAQAAQATVAMGDTQFVAVTHGSANVFLNTTAGGVDVLSASGLYKTQSVMTCQDGSHPNQTINGTNTSDGDITLHCPPGILGVTNIGSIDNR
jgi:anti-sigma factor RsiW